MTNNSQAYTRETIDLFRKYGLSLRRANEFERRRHRSDMAGWVCVRWSNGYVTYYSPDEVLQLIWQVEEWKTE